MHGVVSAQPVSNALEQNITKGQAVHDLFLCFNVSFAEDGGVFVPDWHLGKLGRPVLFHSVVKRQSSFVVSLLFDQC